MRPVYSVTLVICLFTNFSVNGQSQDSVKAEKVRKNVVKLNLSSLVIYERAFLIGYERVIKKNQSFSVQAGPVSINYGLFVPADSLTFVSSTKSTGYSLAGDYRFYLPKENKDRPPHGVYIGPYVSYVYIYNENNLIIGTSPVALKSQFDVLSIGGQLGYQFLLGKRWTIDLILIGPSLTNYKVKMELEGSIDPSQVNPELQKILDRLAGRFPLVQSLLNNEIVEFNGKTDIWSAGFRYSLHVGFRF